MRTRVSGEIWFVGAKRFLIVPRSPRGHRILKTVSSICIGPESVVHSVPTVVAIGCCCPTTKMDVAAMLFSMMSRSCERDETDSPVRGLSLRTIRSRSSHKPEVRNFSISLVFLRSGIVSGKIIGGIIQNAKTSASVFRRDIGRPNQSHRSLLSIPIVFSILIVRFIVVLVLIILTTLITLT